MFSSDRWIVLLNLLLVTACGPPLPVFGSAADTQTVDVVSQTIGGGIRVDAPTGISPAAGAALAEAVAKQMRLQGVPAAAGSGNVLSDRLTAQGSETASGGNLVIDLIWTLTDPHGETMSDQQDAWLVPRDDWLAADPDLITGIAKATAGPFADRIMGPGPSGPASIALAGVTGVEEEGAAALILALRRGLLTQGQTVTADPAAASVIVAGRFTATPIDADREQIRLVWDVTEAENGAEIGTLTQESLVKPGVLQENWSEAAFFIVEGVLSDLIGVIRDR